MKIKQIQHQNCLVFLKGDPKKAAAAVGDCEFALDGFGEDV